MKHYFILTTVSLVVIVSGSAQQMNTHHDHEFANRYLSNLKHTAVNADLLPCTNHKINLGSASKNWKNFYLAGNMYKGHNRFLSSDTLGNTFLGISAGKVNTGEGNTALGREALYSNTTGFHNTATGYQALFNNTTGIWNDAYGYQALYNNTEGNANNAYGWQVLYNTTTGFYNSGFGGYAMHENTTGSWNSAIGVFALAGNISGGGNNAVGADAMWSNTTNSFNTAIGHEAGGWNSSYSNFSLDYSNATFLGAFTNSDSGLVNITAIGYDAKATASNQVTVGNTSVTSIGGYVNWSNFSDGRYKKNVKEDVPGLEFITQLRPVTYTLDVDGIEKTKKGTVERNRNFNMPGPHGDISIPGIAFEKSGKQQSAEWKAKQEKEKVVYTGFIAQEVEQAAKKLNYDFSGVDKPKTEKGFYALRYGDFIVPLVKAVQEQQKQIDQQQKQIEELKALVKSNTKQAVANTTDLLSADPSAFLKQNAPNPFSKSTIIRYNIPGNASNSQIIVTDMNGNLLKTFTATKGEGQINIGGGELPAATYNYTLLVNGKKVDTKQMVLTK